ncbi:amino acid ABC transporter permease [Microbispora triticiradicis]|uniref:amino acid ABC transporter permease n=1 Tax=Microbispora triticiradicis TaxID=2200763 RepID=UPI001AD72622|nr:amino acid ABC transporter permease [Microbispora triticiradicis]MBO4274407.1 ABC transporter permease subunit [Microbispora triticiradicis]
MTDGHAAAPYGPPGREDDPDRDPDRPGDPPEWVKSERQLRREAELRARGRRSVSVATASTLVVVVTLIVVITRSPGWPRVQETFLSPEAFAAALPDVLRGFLLNVKIFLVAEVLILVVGLLVALVRGLRSPVFFPLRALAVLYTDIFRGIPTILLIYLVGFGVPALQLQGAPNDPVTLGIIALVLSYGAYVAEVFRAGIESVHPSQRAAARSLALTHGQTMRYVVLPQAVRRVVPPLLNDFVSLQKDTALVAVLGPLEALRQASIHASSDFNYTPYLAAALLFIALTVPMARLTDQLAARAARRRTGGGDA